VRATACTLMVVTALAAACGSLEASRGAEASPAIVVPAEDMPPDIKCLVEHGARIVKVIPPQVPGDLPGYQLELELPPDEAREVSAKCQELAPESPQRTDEELLVVYERWLDQRECLIELGYTPDEPTSFETFLSGFRSPQGPWTPIDGIDTQNWTTGQYQEAKEQCTLEFFDRS